MCFRHVCRLEKHVSLHDQEDVKRPDNIKDRIPDAELPSASHAGLPMPERVYKLKPEPDLTLIPGILKPQHHAADVEPDQS